MSAGDSAAFSSIVLATRERLVRLGARVLGGIEEAEDAVQEAYVKAYRSLVLGRFDHRSSVATWLYRIVLHAALDARRARARADARSRSSEADCPGSAAWDGAGTAEARVALRELAAFLGALPEEQHVVVLLKTIEGLTSAEIAEVLRCSEGAIEQRLVRARTALRKMELER